MFEKKMTRKDFLKNAGVGAAALALANKMAGADKALAAVSSNASGGGGGGGFELSATAPDDTDVLWIDTGNEGVARYWNGSKWAFVRSTWQ